MDKEVINISLIALGESGVGKTSLSTRFAKNTFSDSYLATIGIDFYVKEYVLPSYTLKVSLWDTAGQEQLRAVTSNTIKRANGVAICYDVTEQDSFEQMSYWIQDVKEKALEVPVIIIGNKIDCENLLFENEKQLAEDFAKKNDFQYFRCSAKSGENVEHAFFTLLKLTFFDILFILRYAFLFYIVLNFFLCPGEPGQCPILSTINFKFFDTLDTELFKIVNRFYVISKMLVHVLT